MTPAVRSARSRLGAAVGLLVLLAAACGSPAVESAPTGAPSVAVPVGPLVQKLTGEVSVDGAWEHLQELQRIADENGGNRAAGTSGYEASVEYVSGVLRAAGFAVSTPTFAGSDDDDGARGGGTGRNVIAQTSTGNPDAVVVIGAHLDSVPEGPGIVDNGSGVASLLEIATRLGAEPEVQNAVRFAFFGDEESGAVGSAGYVESLPADDLARIKLYLNVDMVGSSNGGYFAQGGEGRDEEEAGPAGSATVGRVLAEQLAAAGVMAPEIIEFVGDDESPFIEAGVPVGGAENGDAEEKTAQQARDWGGQVGAVYDPCYHQACDRLDNVNRDVLDRYLRAVAGTLARFATSTVQLR